MPLAATTLMRLRTTHALLATAAVLAVPAAGAQQRPAVRPLGPTVAVSRDSFVVIMGVRQLPDGRVLLNDPISRRVLMFDSTLASPSVVVDSAAGAMNAYGPMAGGLIAYRGDSTLFVDPQSLSMLVIDPTGKIARVASVPRPEDARGFASASNGIPGFDASGRLVYRAPTRFTMGGRGPGGPGGPGGAPPQAPDTAPLLRIDLATRKLDTIAWVKVQVPNLQVTPNDSGGMTVRRVFNPLPVIDEWAVLADGSVAVVRGRDYRVDVIGADGSRTAAAKIPFDWQRMSDEDKVALIDSIKAVRERMPAASPMTTTMSGSGAAGGGGAVREQVSMTIVGGPGGGAGGPNQTIRSSGAAQISFVDPSELPDYKPPFFAGAARADADGNLWVRTIPTTGIAGGPVYDVIDRTGKLVDQVQVPAGRQIVGFGAGGVVYLTARSGSGATVLERARVR